MNAKPPSPLVPPAARLAQLRLRLQRDLTGGDTVQVSRPSDLRLLQDLSPDELRAFAVSCNATVVSRVGGRQFEFTGASWY